jgi:hypothetical protein
MLRFVMRQGRKNGDGMAGWMFVWNGTRPARLLREAEDLAMAGASQEDVTGKSIEVD